jgi:hypothetical protein
MVHVMKVTLMRVATSGAVLLMGAAACTQKDVTEVDTRAKGGSGGASLDAGTSGTSGSGGDPAGAGGSGGSNDVDMPEAGTARFTAVLDGERVRLTALDPVWVYGCEDLNPRLAQRAGDSWTLLRDERPEGLNLHHAAHYLDGAYQSDCNLSLGCDVGGCASFVEFLEDFGLFQARLTAREYVQVGLLEAPACYPDDAGANLDAGGDAGHRSVPAIESRAPAGPLAVRLRYFRDSSCRTEAITTDIAVE